MIIKNLLIGGMMLFAHSVFAQFSMDGEIRPRMEYKHGYKNLADSAMDATISTSQRTRLNLNYNADNYKVGLSLQDVRTWGSVSTLNSTNDFFTVHQAWTEVSLIENVSVKVGRQELVYDDHRLFGNVGWAPQSRSHDIALVKYEGGLKVHLGFTKNLDESAGYKDMHYIWMNKSLENVSLSLVYLKTMYDTDLRRYYINLMEVENQTNYLSDYTINKYYIKNDIQTFGGRLTTKYNAFSLNGNFYLQTGLNLSAYLIGVDAAYKLSDNLSLTTSYEQQSGNDLNPYGEDFKKDKAFMPLFGTNHKFNGNMDYFYVGNHARSVGLQDITFGVKYKEGKMSFNAVTHMFNAVGNIGNGYDANLNQATEANLILSQNLGYEVDISIGYDLSKEVNIKIGYSQFFGKESLEEVKEKEFVDLENKKFEDSNGKYEIQPYIGSAFETSNWSWIMITVKPKFL
ncbi:MAG: alginate export family protein [Flavobacteriales bacterium]|nr:alginate export family protein [Flavobacteriales bacterium]